MPDPSKTSPRPLALRTVGDVIAEVERLAERPLTALGRWDLPATCAHLAYFVHGCLEGFPLRPMPAPVRWLARQWLLKKWLRTRSMGRNLPTIPASVHPPGGDIKAINDYVSVLIRLASASDPLYPSPLVGRLSADQWRELHVIHAAHHLALLVPDPG